MNIPQYPWAEGDTLYASALNSALGAVQSTADQTLALYGAVDTTGATDMSVLINAAFAGSSTAKKRLWIGKGTYRLNNTLTVLSNLDVLCHAEAEFIAYFNGGGRSGGIVSMTTAQWNALPEVSPRNIKISGGVWRRNGTVSADGKIWTGNTGGVFVFWAEDVQLTNIRVTGYHLGRAFQPGGRRWLIDNVDISNPNNYLSLPCPGIGGTGGIRWYSGGPATITRVRAVCGDDCFQAVPAATDQFGLDVSDVTYQNCYGVSVKARVCVAGLVVPNSFPGDIQGSLTIGIRNVTFRNIRGEGKLAFAISNDDSEGDLGTLLFDDVRLGIRRDLDGVAHPYCVEFLATDTGSGGVGPLIMRDCELLNVIEGGIRSRGTQVGHMIFRNWKQPAPDNAATLYYPVQIKDAKKVVFDGGSIAGPVGGTKSILFMGDNVDATAIDYVSISDMDITGVPNAQYAVNGPPLGFVFLDMTRCRVFPLAGATDARAIRFSEITTGGSITDNDFSLLSATTYINTPAGVNMRGNAISSASVNGVIRQSVAAAPTVAWDGRSRLIRLTSTAPTTIDTLSIPAGFVIRESPLVTLYGVSANMLTLSAAGNIVPVGATSFGAAQSVLLLYDITTAKWIQVGVYAATTATTDVNTQSAAGGTLAWAAGRAMIRVNVAGTVTTLTGTPTQCVLLTIRSVVPGVIINNTTTVRLTPAANITLDADECVMLQYDVLNSYWVQVGGGQR